MVRNQGNVNVGLVRTCTTNFHIPLAVDTAQLSLPVFHFFFVSDVILIYTKLREKSFSDDDTDLSSTVNTNSSELHSQSFV